MKNKLLFTFLILAIFSANSQIERTNEKAFIPKGKWMTSGTISVNFFDNKTTDINNDEEANGESDYINFNFTPKVGYSIAENWVAGIGLGYTYSRNKGKSFEKDSLTSHYQYTTNGYSINPFVRRYVSTGKKLLFFFQGETKYQYSKSKDINNYPSENNDYHTSANLFFIGIMPGLNFFLNNHWALETTIGRAGYEYTKSSSDSSNIHDQQSNNFFIDLDLSDVYFGISYFF